eukprot:14889407-Ditylum_brightwellii.AAC.1
MDILDSPTRHNRSSSLSGKQIIDSVLVLSELVQAIQKSGYTKFDQIMTTDHRGVYVDFDIEVLFENGDIKLDNEKVHTLWLNDPYMVKDYVTAVHKYLGDHNFWKKYNYLIKSDKFQPKQAETVDKIFLN